MTVKTIGIGACVFVMALGGALLAQDADRVGHTRSIRLTERAGVARRSWPVEVTVRFETASLKSAKSIRLFHEKDGKKTPRAYQVLESTPHKATDSVASIPQTFVRLVFLADVPAGGTVTL